MIDFDDTKGMTMEECRELEAFTKFKLPAELIDLFSRFAGGRFKNNKSYFLQWNTDFEIELDSWIIGVETKDSIIENWKHRTYLKEFMEWFNLSESYVEPEHLFPVFALINGAVYLAIGGRHDGKVYYVDNGDDGIINIATNLTEFYEKLTLTSLD